MGLGTFIAIEAAAADAATRALAIGAAGAAVERVERLMHPTRDGSDLARLNMADLNVPHRVHGWTWATLALCKRLNVLSHGVFDPCVNTRGGTFDDVELPEPQTAVLHARVELDLGGIAKGFAVDRALDALRESGCTSGLVNAGGDVGVFGESPHRLWCRHRGHAAELRLHNAALAASDADETHRPTEHRGHYNGVERGAAVRGFAAVIAPNAALADGLTKCLLAHDASTALLSACGARRIDVPAARW